MVGGPGAGQAAPAIAPGAAGLRGHGRRWRARTRRCAGSCRYASASATSCASARSGCRRGRRERRVCSSPRRSARSREPALANRCVTMQQGARLVWLPRSRASAGWPRRRLLVHACLAPVCSPCFTVHTSGPALATRLHSAAQHCQMWSLRARTGLAELHGNDDSSSDLAVQRRSWGQARCPSGWGAVRSPTTGPIARRPPQPAPAANGRERAWHTRLWACAR